MTSFEDGLAAGVAITLFGILLICLTCADKVFTKDEAVKRGYAYYEVSSNGNKVTFKWKEENKNE